MTMALTSRDAWLTQLEAAHALDLNPRQVKELADAGKIATGTPHGRRVKYRRVDVERLVMERRAEAGA